MSILQEIIINKLQEIKVLKKTHKYSLEIAELYVKSKKILINSEFQLISEIKPKSPSSGQILPQNLDLVELAKEYEKNGAGGLSVLTDYKYFGGNTNLFKKIRANTNLPILRKEFIIDEYQVFETKLLGADLILLIVKILDRGQLQRLLKLSLTLDLQPIIEINNLEELNLAKTVLDDLHEDGNSSIVEKFETIIFGINNRNLGNFSVSLENSLNLISSLPANSMSMSLSGIKTTEDIKIIEQVGFNGCLIGEGLYKNPNLFQFFNH